MMMMTDETTEIRSLEDFLAEECDIFTTELDAFAEYTNDVEGARPTDLYRQGKIETLRDSADAFHNVFMGLADSESHWADQYIEETGMLSSLDKSLRMYFDVEAFTRDLFMSSLYSLELSDGSIAVFRS